jgi:hypothetical protein
MLDRHPFFNMQPDTSGSHIIDDRHWSRGKEHGKNISHGVWLSNTPWCVGVSPQKPQQKFRPASWNAPNIRSLSSRQAVTIPFARTVPSGAASCKILKQPAGIWNEAGFAALGRDPHTPFPAITFLPLTILARQ